MKRMFLLLAMGALVTSVTANPGKPVSGVTNDAQAEKPRSSQSSAAPQSKPADKKDADCGCEVKVPSNVLAVVNGAKIEIKDVDEKIRQLQTMRNALAALVECSCDGKCPIIRAALDGRAPASHQLSAP